MFEVVSTGKTRKGAQDKNRGTRQESQELRPVPISRGVPDLALIAPQAVIKVIGIGGCGGNAVNHLSYQGMSGVEFISANTDAQALAISLAEHKLLLGCNGGSANGSTGRGLGAGGNPQIGREAAEASSAEIAELIKGTDMLFIAAGMGGGTGTGGAPVVARIARELGVLTVAVVTRPTDFAGKKHKRIAEEGISVLEQHVDSLIAISNARMLSILGHDANMQDVMQQADDVLCGAVRGIADLITQPGVINLDFADVRTVMAQAGHTIMGTGQAAGAERAADAVERAISSPLLEDTHLHDARGILYNITVTQESFTAGEMQEIGQRIEDLAGEDADNIYGVVFNDSMGDELRVTVVAAGLSRPNKSSDRKPDHHKYAEHLKQQKLWSADDTVAEGRRGVPPTRTSYSDYDWPAFLRKQAD